MRIKLVLIFFLCFPFIPPSLTSFPPSQPIGWWAISVGLSGLSAWICSQYVIHPQLLIRGSSFLLWTASTLGHERHATNKVFTKRAFYLSLPLPFPHPPRCSGVILCQPSETLISINSFFKKTEGIYPTHYRCSILRFPALEILHKQREPRHPST